MDIKLTLSYADLLVLFRAKVLEYFLQAGMFGRHEQQKDRDESVEAYCNSQFKHVLRHLRGESVGAEASDMTAAFMTNYSMQLKFKPARRMGRMEKVQFVTEWFTTQHGRYHWVKVDAVAYLKGIDDTIDVHVGSFDLTHIKDVDLFIEGRR